MLRNAFLFAFLILLHTGPKLAAQSTVQLCGIWFDYDAAGNRIMRYQDCKAVPSDGSGSSGGGGAQSRMARNEAAVTSDRTAPVVSPNPTTGPYLIRMPEAGKVHYHWYDARGSIISSGTFEGITHSGSIGSLPPGNYLLKIYWKGQTFSYTIIKHN